jgi:hypothetical protein
VAAEAPADGAVRWSPASPSYNPPVSLLLLFGEPYHRALLETARRLLDEHQPAVALVTAHMACEIYTEQVVATALKKRALGADLEEAMASLARGHVTNKRIRNLYVSLTGDAIHKQLFWAPFTASWELRNLAVHRGIRVSESQAREGYMIAVD